MFKLRVTQGTLAAIGVIGCGLLVAAWLLEGAGLPDTDTEGAAKPSQSLSKPEHSQTALAPVEDEELVRASVQPVGASGDTPLSVSTEPSAVPANGVKESYEQWKSRWPDAQELPKVQWCGDRTPIESAVFEQKYAAYSTDELELARDRLAGEFQIQRKRAFGERLKAGEYDAFPVDPGRPVHVGNTPSNAPLRMVSRSPTNAEVQEIKVVQLPFEEYPDLYNLNDEVKWLTGAVASKAK